MKLCKSLVCDDIHVFMSYISQLKIFGYLKNSVFSYLVNYINLSINEALR